MRLLFATFLMLLTPWALAGDLTSKEVQIWIKAMPGIEDWLDQQEDKLPDNDTYDDTSIETVFQRGIQDLKNAGLYDSFGQKVKSAGFSSVEHWADVSQRISLAFLALEMDGVQNANLKQLEAQLKEIRASDLPADQKKAMEQMFVASMSMMKSVEKVSAADKATIAPYRDELARQFDDSGDE